MLKYISVYSIILEFYFTKHNFEKFTTFFYKKKKKIFLLVYSVLTNKIPHILQYNAKIFLSKS